MPSTRAWLLAALALLLFFGSSAACSKDNANGRSCTPMASVACVGAGGCAGGQACNAEGTAYGACNCGAAASDDGGSALEGAGGGPRDSGGDRGSVPSGPPTTGAVHLSFALTRADGSPTTCEESPNIDRIGAKLSPKLSGSVNTYTFDCDARSGSILARPFGDYVLTVEARDADGGTIGASPSVDVSLAGEPCDRISRNDCVKDVDVTIKLD